MTGRERERRMNGHEWNDRCNGASSCCRLSDVIPSALLGPRSHLLWKPFLPGLCIDCEGISGLKWLHGRYGHMGMRISSNFAKSTISITGSPPCTSFIIFFRLLYAAQVLPSPLLRLPPRRCSTAVTSGAGGARNVHELSRRHIQKATIAAHLSEIDTGICDKMSARALALPLAEWLRSRGHDAHVSSLGAQVDSMQSRICVESTLPDEHIPQGLLFSMQLFWPRGQRVMPWGEM